MRRPINCLFLVLFVFVSASAQKINQPVKFVKGASLAQPLLFPGSDSLTGLRTPNGFASMQLQVPSLPADLYFNHLAFFCKKELQVEKAIKIPLRFRLGGIEYTDMLEQKRTGATSANK